MRQNILKKRLIQLSALALVGITGLVVLTLRQTSTPVPITAHRKTAAKSDFTEAYPYANEKFDKFVAESYSYRGSNDWRSFYDHMDHIYWKYKSGFSGWKGTNLKDMLDSEGNKLNSITDNTKRAKEELAFSAGLHRFIKIGVPNFSLDRGYEFYYMQNRGERQCFLQSMLLAGMLQRAGVNTGVAMVYKNAGGEQSNNGHAVDLVRLSNGHDIILDASEQEPFVKQQGLFVKETHYAYVNPVFTSSSNEIMGYRSASDNETIALAKVKALDYDFLHSQFWFYRGERAIGGLILMPKTADGLKRSEEVLQTSVKICPENPLSVFTLGRVYIAEDKMDQARESVADARGLYQKFGWMPTGIKEYIALLGMPRAIPESS
ncbi:MAG: hypothetical protein ABFD64_00910 [Armatimonadota bacterium]